jgi:hypothetical protein
MHALESLLVFSPFACAALAAGVAAVELQPLQEKGMRLLGSHGWLFLAQVRYLGGGRGNGVGWVGGWVGVGGRAVEPLQEGLLPLLRGGSAMLLRQAALNVAFVAATRRSTC